ncbi:glycosyltransferase family 2 protein [Aliiroseovarius sp. PTFE2010]|uniref:glycosyltransferase family 2 protein n=1 Tax=Aliiroseovarius sp. PTFE2010 TaxID=3417190 RepID=UPI003CF2E8C8
MTRFLAILTVRNEGAFLLEWLAHHKAVGFTDFLIFSNDCADGTDAMLDRLAAMGEITHVPNPGPHKRGPQWDALKTAADHPALHAADWAMVMDVDEFVNVHVGNHTLTALLNALPQATAIPLTWRVFGNAGVVSFTDKPVTETFTRAAPKRLLWPWRASMFKTLFKLDGSYAKLGVHRPRAMATGATPRWFDGAGRELGPDMYEGRPFSQPGQDNYALAQLNHYPLGAMESYIVKLDRGRANRADEPVGMDYWCERNWSSAEDHSIAAITPMRDPIWARLAADNELADLHAGAVRWRRDRFHTLMQQERYRQLFGRLAMTPPAREIPASVVKMIIQAAQNAARTRD